MPTRSARRFTFSVGLKAGPMTVSCDLPSSRSGRSGPRRGSCPLESVAWRKNGKQREMKLRIQPMVVVGSRINRVESSLSHGVCLVYGDLFLARQRLPTLTQECLLPNSQPAFSRSPNYGINLAKNGRASISFCGVALDQGEQDIHRNVDGISHLKTILYPIRVNVVRLVISAQ